MLDYVSQGKCDGLELVRDEEVCIQRGSILFENWSEFGDCIMASRYAGASERMGISRQSRLSKP